MTQTYRPILDVQRAGSMVDRVDPERLRLGSQIKELRNTRVIEDMWGRRYGWLKDNTTAMPWNRAIGAHEYTDEHGTAHKLVMGDDSVLYHKVEDDWLPVLLHDPVVWDGTHCACFATWRNYCYITMGALTGSAPPHNIRYDGLLGEAFAVSLLDPPNAATAVDGGAGALAAADYTYIWTYYDANTGWESDAAPLVTVNIPPGPGIDEIQNLTPDAAATAGTWELLYNGVPTVELQWNAPLATVQAALEALTGLEAGDVAVTGATLNVAGPANPMIFTFDSDLGNVQMLQIIYDALVGPALCPITEETAGAVTTDADRRVQLANITNYTGTGRTIYKRIFRNTGETDDLGNPVYVRLTADEAEIMNNVDEGYDDDNVTCLGDVYIRQQRIPAMRYVVRQRNGQIVWLYDEENGEPATAFYSLSLGYPEAMGLTSFIGGDEDPITGPQGIRDAIFVYKRRSIHVLPRQCDRDESECLVEQTGAVAWATLQNIDSIPCFLSPEGPRRLAHTQEGDVAFVGPDPAHFALARTWAHVQKDRLRYASSVHDRANGRIIWFVQMCDWEDLEDTGGPHNDTAIVWHYTIDWPRGILQIYDLMCDYAFASQVEDTDEWQIWGAFPLGFMGELFEGDHGDGYPTWTDGHYVLRVDGHYLWLDESNLTLEGDGLKGVVLHVDSGTGGRTCLDIEPCHRPQMLVVFHGEVSGLGRVVKLAAAPLIDSTSVVVPGGFGYIVDIANVNAGDFDSIKRWKRAEVHTKGA